MALAQDKCVSERHDQATADGKLTAGQMAAMLNRRFRPEPKITARELKPLAGEWHHSGFIPGHAYGGSHMGRTYFFPPTLDPALFFLTVLWARVEAACLAAEPEVTRYFFSAGFERYQRTNRWQPKWRVYAVLETITCKKSDAFEKKTEISDADYEALRTCNGRDLEAYETFAHFKARMEAEHGCAV